MARIAPPLLTPPTAAGATSGASPSAGNTAGAASRWLAGSATAWLVVALLGQLVFAAYVLRFYGGALLDGEPQRFNRVLPHGWVAGATVDNALLVAHLAFTVLIVLAGGLQLLPAIRRRWPALHRWTGRSYLLAAAVLALGGLWMVWVRGGAVGDLSQHLAISVNAALILLCAAMAWRAARARRFDLHRRWALRLWVAVSGVWLFRVGLMAWVGLWRAPVGFDPKTFSGPFLTVLAWSLYAVLPLLVLEAVLRAQRSQATGPQAATATLLVLLTLITAFGVVMATLGMWGPRMR